MQVQILGAHQGESRDMRFMSILIDGHLAIDAGGLTNSLSLDEQHAVDAVLITHQHYDHIKDLPMFAHNLWDTRDINVYCTYDTRLMLERHIFNNEIWPSMVKNKIGDHHMIFHSVEPGHEFSLLGYSILPVPMVHTVPTVGYLVKRDGKSVFYTADTRGDGNPQWASIRPDLLIIETTMSNQYDAAARRFKHMTPMSLGQELRAFHAQQGYYPRTVCVHINPRHEEQVRKELAELSNELQADITPAHEGMIIDIT
jgi:ribonuclease BN (tRNA processing enzyme)